MFESGKNCKKVANFGKKCKNFKKKLKILKKV